MSEVLRYLGIAKEITFGTKVAPKFFIDQASSDINPPDGAELIKPSGLTRTKRDHAPGMYIPEGSVDFVADPPLFYYLLWILLGDKSTVDNTSNIADEATPSDSNGIISATLVNLPVAPGSIIVENDTPLQEAHDDGFGIIVDTTGEVDEVVGTTGGAETTLAFTLAEDNVAPGTLIIHTDVPADVAEDDGWGRITELNASGVTGTIDYKTGNVTLAGLAVSTTFEADYFRKSDTQTITGTINYATGVLLVTGVTVSHAYTTTYDEGTFEHTIISDNDNVLPSATLSMGKDEFEHVFTGSVFSQIVLTVNKEWAMISLNAVCKKDEKETILTLATVTIPQGYPLPFHKVTMKAADYGSALADISTVVEELTLTINNNGDGEGGVTLGSRFPRKIYGGDLEVMVDLVLSFSGTDELEDFWGGATSPSADGTQEKAYQILLDGGVLGDITFDLYKAIMNGPPTISPSGRERITQGFTVEALYDTGEAVNIKATCNSVYNYSEG